ncbi:MAG: hypothetical protein D4R67_00105 [Bacteroidetes bacterium]|nr:MAG: hypothetical protein D4R67_00105 [Bacteroidota bacterium]
MLIYRFRINSEEHEEFIREICIQPGQRFIDFYHCLLESAELIPAEQASFYLTDKRYKKDREISLHPVEKQVKRYDPELDEMVPVTIVPKLMKDTRLKDFMEDPHQRMIFEYHGREYFTFLLELVKIMQSDDEGLYPKCVKWVGELPKKLEVPAPEIHEPKEIPLEDSIKSLIPSLDALVKLEGIEEDEEELAEIEDNLGAILFGEDELKAEPPPAAPTLRKKVPAVHEPSVEDIDEPQEEDEDEKEDFSDGMEHLEDYDDIENIGIDYNKLRDDSYDD